MATNTVKIRLGAPDVMTLFGTNDLGSSAGGCELTYTPTNFQVEIDQSILPVKVFTTKEEFKFAVALAEYTIKNVLLIMGYATTGVTTVTGTPATDTAYFGGTISEAQGTFDWSVPKNDGTTNKLRGHFHQVYSAAAYKIDYKRTEATRLDKLELQALADLTQAAGQQAGWLREEY